MENRPDNPIGTDTDLPRQPDLTAPANHEQEPDSSLISPLSVAYFGVREKLAEFRLRRAGDKMEKMDHKIAFYHDLGHEGDSPAIEAREGVLKARSPVERYFAIREAEKRRIVSVYGGRETRPNNEIPIFLYPLSRAIPRLSDPARIESKRDADRAVDEFASFATWHRENHPDMYPTDEEKRLRPGDAKEKERRLGLALMNYENKPVYQAYLDQRDGPTPEPPITRKNVEQRKLSGIRGIDYSGPLLKRAQKKRDRQIGKIQVQHKKTEKYRQKRTTTS